MKGIDLGYNAAGATPFSELLFKSNPIKEKIVEVIGKNENLNHLGFGDVVPDFMVLDTLPSNEVVQRAIFITATDFSSFDTLTSNIEYKLLEKYLTLRNPSVAVTFIPITKFIDIDHESKKIVIKEDNTEFLKLVSLVKQNVYAQLNKDLIQIGESLLSDDFNIIKSKFT